MTNDIIKTVQKPATDVQVAQWDGKQECAEQLVRWVTENGRYAKVTVIYGPRKDSFNGPYTAPFWLVELRVETNQAFEQPVYTDSWIIFDNGAFSVLSDEQYKETYNV